MTEQPPVPSGYPPPPPGAGYQPPFPPPQGYPSPYISWIRRVGASFIDLFPFAILLYACPVIAVAIGDMLGDKSCTIDPNTGATSCSSSGMGPIIGADIAPIFYLVGLAFWLWNWGYRQGRTGSSIGKSVLRFKVVSELTGQPIGFGLSIVRQIAHFLDGICYIGYLLPLFTAKRQTIADMIMGTICLPIEPSKAPPEQLPARRSRTPWIIAGAAAVVIVAVVALVVIGHKSASRQVVLPFTGLHQPSAVAVDTTGAVYVVDQNNNRVLKLPAGATTPTTLPFTGLNKPSAVAVDTTGAVYVADSGASRVLKLPAGAATPTTLPFTGLTDPDGVAVDSAGAVYVADASNKQVLKLAAGSSAPTVLPFTSNGPTGVAVDAAGTVYVADEAVLRLTAGATTPDTVPFTVTNASSGGAWGVAVDTAGTVYITDPYWQRVVKLAAGSTTQVVLPFTGLGRALGVAVDTAGNVYVADSDRVLKLPAG
jgi:uncharacterized RDD family membrane protein YckC/streptogramin lyase